MGDGVFTVSVPSSANAPPIFRLDGTADTLVFRELSTSPEHSPSTGGPSSPYLLITGTPTIERISQVEFERSLRLLAGFDPRVGLERAPGSPEPRMVYIPGSRSGSPQQEVFILTPDGSEVTLNSGVFRVRTLERVSLFQTSIYEIRNAGGFVMNASSNAVRNTPALLV